MKTLIRYGTALIAAALVACGGADTTGSEVFVAEMQRPKAAPGVVSGSILCADVSAATDAGGVGSCRSPFASLAQVPAASTTATVLDADAFMNWAQGRLPELFPGTPATLGAEGFVYRAYSTGNFIGVTTAGDVYAMGPATSGALLALGNLSAFLCAVYPERCIVQVSSISTQSALSYGKTAILDIAGSALDHGMSLDAPGCSILTELVGSSTTSRRYSCKVSIATELSASVRRADGSTALSVGLPVPDPLLTIVTSMGTLVLELNPAKAPITVDNFLRYTNDGFYSNLLFHRVISTFMIQGGGFGAGMVPKIPTYAPIKLESNNGLSNVRGSIAMARTSVADSATSQFFINVVDNAFLNYTSASSPGYAVFGKVVQGLDVVDLIRAVPTATRSGYQDVPVADVVIYSATQTR